MKFAVLLFFAAIAPSIVLSQISEADSVAGIQILKHSWLKERIDWQNSPFSVPNENFNDMRDRVRNERRPTSAIEERNIKVATEEKKKPTEPPRYIFSYRITIQNGFTKSIRELDWDYVFTDKMTGEELGRRQFTSTEKIGAGKKKDLVVKVSSPPTHSISVYKLGTNEGAGLSEAIVISRILFEDNTEWKLPSQP